MKVGKLCALELGISKDVRDGTDGYERIEKRKVSLGIECGRVRSRSEKEDW